jgi:endothelin-converting enzyme/putative endopeptidase
MGTHQSNVSFMSWATIWRSKARDEATKKSGIHIPQECTVHMYHCKMWIPFYQAFGIQVNDGMYIAPEKS